MLNNIVVVTKPMFKAAYAWLVPSGVRMGIGIGIGIRIGIAVRAYIRT